MRSNTARAAVLGALAALTCAATAAAAFDPAVEARNYAKTGERQAEYSTPEYQALLRETGLREMAAAVQITATDPERRFSSNLCASHMDGCAGDVRLYDFMQDGHGIVEPVLWTARNGATISGHVWATREGPARRPGVVITNGSVQAPEQVYWFIAQTLAKRGYVVLTADPQGQGQSDTRGEGADGDEGVPSQAGRPFFDGTEDALDFFFSSPGAPYRPRPSCTTGTSHAPKQERRVRERRNAGHNPYFAMLDRTRVGLAGHSFGAAGISFVGQRDPRVRALVAFDNLDTPEGAGAASTAPCPSAPQTRETPPITRPALGISADYGIPPRPNTSEPDPAAKSEASRAYSAAGVDTGEIVIRGGTHYEFDYVPNPAFNATLRGADLTAWYTGAWFDSYLKDDAGAERRLLSGRWRADAADAALDPAGAGNLLSFYYRSRLDVARDAGGRFVCEDLRAGCAGGLAADDGEPADYSYLRAIMTPDRGATAGAAAATGATRGARGSVRLLPRRLRTALRRGAVRARVGCTGPCSVTLNVQVAGRRAARRTVRLPRAGRRTVRLALNRDGRRLLRARPSLRLDLTAVVRDPSGRRLNRMRARPRALGSR